MGAAPDEIVRRARTIATVGMSGDESKPAHRVPRALLHAGFDVVPVHPEAEEILGRRAYPSVTDVPDLIDVVQVFRPADEAPGIAREAVEVGAGAMWLQDGIVSAEAREIAESAGLEYVEDDCMDRVRATHDISRI